jgi:hypothetical protein
MEKHRIFPKGTLNEWVKIEGANEWELHTSGGQFKNRVGENKLDIMKMVIGKSGNGTMGIWKNGDCTIGTLV